MFGLQCYLLLRVRSCISGNFTVPETHACDVIVFHLRMWTVFFCALEVTVELHSIEFLVWHIRLRDVCGTRKLAINGTSIHDKYIHVWWHAWCSEISCWLLLSFCIFFFALADTALRAPKRNLPGYHCGCTIFVYWRPCGSALLHKNVWAAPLAPYSLIGARLICSSLGAPFLAVQEACASGEGCGSTWKHATGMM